MQTGVASQDEQVIFPARPEQCSAARGWIRAYFSQRDLLDVGEVAALAVSETFTNALRCPIKDPDGEPVIPIRIVQLPSMFRVETYDADPELPPPIAPPPDPDDIHHRGLWVVDMTTDQRGCTPAADGTKCVWFTLKRT
jgi:anti-sigma regulatory factor (Ser/Thr protein kinase)